MLVNPSRILKTVYKTLLLGIPQIIYNPFLESNLLVPLEVKETSTYINYNLHANDVCKLSNYIHRYNDSLELVPIKILNDDKEDYYLSINVYNCTSSIFLTNEEVTRCEINTYIIDGNGNYGTLIIDYITNGQSMDPISLIKLPEKNKICSFIKLDDNYEIKSFSVLNQLNLTVQFDTNENDTICKLDDSLLKYTDNIFYKDGILDKLYYDESLVYADTFQPLAKVSFEYRNLELSKPSSVFYFKKKINFVGSMWHNLYKIRRHKPTIRERIGKKFALSYISRK
tara:strand:+ start:6304 stop:7155 length:852 start_codon:yes stop_codon:yes gene_type:complete